MAVTALPTPTRATGPEPTTNWAALLVVLTGTFISTLDFFIINVAVPSIGTDLDATAGQLQWMVAGFALAVAAGVMTAGRLGDIYGHRRMYAWGLGLFVLASAACGLSPTAGILVEARVLQGVAAALLTPQALVLLTRTFSGAALVRAFTAYGLCMGVAAVFGQLIGGVLIEADLLGSGWRSCFLINVPVGLAALLAVTRTLPADDRGRGVRLDVVGALLATGALVTAVLPLIQGREQGWPLWTWLCLVESAVLAAVFFAHQRWSGRRGGAPLVDLRLLRVRALAVGLLAQLVFSTGLASFFFVFAVYAQQGRGLSALASGELFAAIGVGYLVTSTLAGSVAARLGRQTAAVGATVTALGLLGVLETVHAIGTWHPVWWLAPALALTGAGIGLVIAPLAAVTLGSVDAAGTGTASGLLATVTQLGGALGIAGVGVAFYGHLGSGAETTARIPGAFELALGLLIAVYVVVALVVQLLPRASAGARL